MSDFVFNLLALVGVFALVCAVVSCMVLDAKGRFGFGAFVLGLALPGLAAAFISPVAGFLMPLPVLVYACAMPGRIKA